MALPVSIKGLIEQRVVESTRIEYKSDWNPEAVLHSICAFADENVNGRRAVSDGCFFETRR